MTRTPRNDSKGVQSQQLPAPAPSLFGAQVSTLKAWYVSGTCVGEPIFGFWGDLPDGMGIFWVIEWI